jgi:hypothetical protein
LLQKPQPFLRKRQRSASHFRGFANALASRRTS